MTRVVSAEGAQLVEAQTAALFGDLKALQRQMQARRRMGSHVAVGTGDALPARPCSTDAFEHAHKLSHVAADMGEEVVLAGVGWCRCESWPACVVGSHVECWMCRRRWGRTQAPWRS